MEVQLANIVPPTTYICRTCNTTPTIENCDFGLVYLKTGQLEIRCKKCIFSHQKVVSECFLCKNEGKELSLSGPQPQLRVHLCDVHDNNSTAFKLDSLIISKLTEAGLTKPVRLRHKCFYRKVQITLDGKFPTKCNYC